MTWNTLDPAHRAHLETTLTSGQVDVLVLHLAGCGTRRIADMLGISRTTAKDRLRTALNALADTRKEHA